MSALYLGPVRDAAHAGLLQARWENYPEPFRLENAAVAYCMAKLAYACGVDEAGDAAWSGLSEAVANDGIDNDDMEAVEAQLEYEYPRLADWVECLIDEAQRVAGLKAARAVVAFVRAVMQ